VPDPTARRLPNTNGKASNAANTIATVGRAMRDQNANSCVVVSRPFRAGGE